MNADLHDAFANVLEQSLRCHGGVLGFISADAAVLRADHARRMARAEAVIAETARILAAPPKGRPRAASPLTDKHRSPAGRRLDAKLAALHQKLAATNLDLALAALRQRLTTPPTSN